MISVHQIKGAIIKKPDSPKTVLGVNLSNRTP